ncbi:hypothetical protein PARPLA_02229 [Rhodobacteraceae bacterium THAF1]|uniref:DGQHR domain-containing protein n=1 Tax=Palleronia sp. THAF1 TaxID=2587842 RepID=UPI000F41620A|nr:DGQHR domain-containing protein [Palleronia sp. THAF1]QFU07939.1 hypothetical protein FIU81_04550 [Palleronia sp. THAF1]VDC25773.1 hypothetical protein PARPLA_02229 [Rhodobacteraceae bacterium THAF1]
MASTARKITTRKPKKRKKLSEEERRRNRIESSHKRTVRTTFANAGFVRIACVCDKEFTFNHVTSDFDDCFVHENIVILTEYTTSAESKVGDHIKGKQGVYNEVLKDPAAFVKFLKLTFPEISKNLHGRFKDHHMKVKILYCSLNSVKQQHKSLVPDVTFFDYHIAKYFETVSKATRSSSRFEVLAFLGLQNSDVGNAALSFSGNKQSQSFHCSILPETHSNFGQGFKVVSFYASPSAILERAHVLRRYGWRKGESAYQRLISVKKIQDIRRYLLGEKRVFVNNIIATLPAETKLLDGEGDTVKPELIQETKPGTIQLPQEFNTVGLIDGQHRVYSYHEGGLKEEMIREMREQQNLLVTGIIFPKGMSETDKLKFEAKLFLEINSNQMSAKSEIKQEITSILDPFSPDSVSRIVIGKLNDSSGPLQDAFQQFDFQKDRMKTSSVVSFALKPLVAPSGPLFPRASGEIQEKFKAKSDDGLRDYTDFCCSEINKIFSAVKKNLADEKWTSDRKVEDRFLTTRNVNSIIAALRNLVRDTEPLSFDQYDNALSTFGSFDSSSFGSSRYNAMGESIYLKFLRPVANLAPRR